MLMEAVSAPNLAVQEDARRASRKSSLTVPDRSRPKVSVIKSAIDDLAAHYGVDALLIRAVVHAESHYDPFAVSPAGAIGLMQVMPATASEYGVVSADLLFDAEINLRVGIRHLKRLIKKYGKPGPAVMAYNAGEGALERGDGFVAYPETQRYTHQVLSEYLVQKGILPYSSIAEVHLGLKLTPDMATVGAADKPSAAMVQPVADLDAQLRRSMSVRSPGAPALRASPGTAERKDVSRLSSRLETPSNTMLRSRIYRPSPRMPASRIESDAVRGFSGTGYPRQ